MIPTSLQELTLTALNLVQLGILTFMMRELRELTKREKNGRKDDRRSSADILPSSDGRPSARSSRASSARATHAS